MHKHRRDAGFSLAALIFFATAASILAAAAVPAYQMQAKREREKELIFRGEEYARAILKYQKKFGVYPTSVDQLIQTNGGQVKKVTPWGKRRLAYTVHEQREGHYVVEEFDLERGKVQEVERVLKISDTIFRHLLVRQDEGNK